MLLGAFFMNYERFLKPFVTILLTIYNKWVNGLLKNSNK